MLSQLGFAISAVQVIMLMVQAFELFMQQSNKNTSIIFSNYG